MIVSAQHTFRAVVKDATTNEPIPGVTAIEKSRSVGVISDKAGAVVIHNLLTGQNTIEFSYIGYEPQIIACILPLSQELIIQLKPSVLELEDVIVSATRSSRTISNIPTRVETVAAEELDEKAVMQPASIRMALTESTGIQVQQTLQVSASASIRIQGLDGKYTQMLQDGFPLYSGYSGGLSITQIPPLNLKRIEIIKGSSSTLYGGGAIAGLINLVSKEPTAEREITAMVNVNITSAVDISAYYAEKYGKTGLTIFASSNLQKQYDADKDAFSDIPHFTRYTINPKFYYYIDPKTTLSVGLNATIEDRKGGDMEVLAGRSGGDHLYFENNKTDRLSSQIRFDREFANSDKLTIKNSFGYFSRSIGRPSYLFSGKQYSTFTEVSYLIPRERTEWVFGTDAITNHFQQLHNPIHDLSTKNYTLGIFGQNSYNISKLFIAETGLRLDYAGGNHFFALPRVSLLTKISPQWTSRIGGGLGYKTPTLFSEEAEERAFMDILPLEKNLDPERSYGVSADVDYKTRIGEDWSFAANQMFFYTIIDKPIVLHQLTGLYEFVNANGSLHSKGFETNIKVRYDDFSCFLGYTFTEARRKFDGITTENPLTPAHRINANLMYEWNERLILAYEIFYIGRQTLWDGTPTRDYWMMGASAQYKIGKFTFFVNFENFTDTRQSRWGALWNGNRQNPNFTDIYAPTDGFIANGGIMIRF